MSATPGTPAWLRETNDRRALELLLEHGALTRNGLGELTGLSKPTASLMVSRLESAGLIRNAGEVSKSRGPSAASYAVRRDRAYGVAVDVDREAVHTILVDLDGEERARVESGHGRVDGPELLGEAIAAVCAEAGVDEGLVSAVHVGLPGSLDPRTDSLTFADDLPGWPTTGVRARLESALGTPVRLGNDVNLAAVAEREEGVGAGADSFALLWMGGGLGLAIDLGGRVHDGASGGAGEIGYLPAPREAAAIDPEARLLQDLLGGEAVLRLAGRRDGAPGDAVAEALEAADEDASGALLDDLARRIVAGVVPVLSVLDPERTVLGGPVGTAGGSPLATRVAERIRSTTRWDPTVVASAVPRDAVLRGAALLIARGLREDLFAGVRRLTA